MPNADSSHSDSRWLVQGYYLEDWPEPGDESEGIADVIVAATEDEAKAEYRRLYDDGNTCSSILAWPEAEWSEHLRRTAESAEILRRRDQ